MRTILLSAILPFIAIGLLASSTVNAQSSQLTEDQKAVLSFDLRFDKLKSSETAKTLKIAEQIKKAQSAAGDGPDMDKVKRIFGAVSAPEDIAALQGLSGGDPSPVEFFVRLEMEDAQSATEAINKMKENGEAVEMAGKTFYKSTDDNAPSNVMATQVDDTTIEIGTAMYITRADRKVFTAGLTESWKKSPEEAVRFAIDLEGASSLVEAGMALGKQSVPPNFAPFIELLGAASDLRISMDFDGENLLTIGTTGKSESEAEDLAGGLNTLVGFGQMFGGQAIQGLKQQSEDLGTMVENMLNAMEAVQDGDSVTLAIPRPEGFAEAIKSVVP